MAEPLRLSDSPTLTALGGPLLVAVVAVLSSSAQMDHRFQLGDARSGQGQVGMPMVFIENRGQADADVLHYVNAPGRSIYFTHDGHVFRLPAHAVMVELLDAATLRVEVRERAQGRVSYFKGSRKNWKVGIPTSNAIAYVQAWPGIDIVYESKGSELKSTYAVAPGSNPDQIRLRYTGHDALRLDELGNLICSTSAGELVETAPIAYQDVDGRRVPVEARFNLLDWRTVAFSIGAYDRAHTLIVDPSFQYAGYLGGSGNDITQLPVGGIAVDADGNAYVTGTTPSTETMGFPIKGGPDLTHNGGRDVFVGKISTDGTTLVYAGYIGGSADDVGLGIAVDASGSAYIAGQTASNAASGFPVTTGPSLTHHGGDALGNDAFVAKLNPEGTALVYAGFIGGNNEEEIFGIAVNSAGEAYIAGHTSSSESENFPVVVGPDLTYNGVGDAFVAKVNASGSALLYAGYIGGATAGDAATGIAVDVDGSAYLVGRTFSVDFPVVGGPDLTHNGALDTFVVKVNATGSALSYSGYVGGPGEDFGRGIAVDASGSAYIAGSTESTETSFPVAVGPDLTHAGGIIDGFVAKVTPSGTSLAYAGYIGGDGDDCILGCVIAVDTEGNAYVAGTTNSSESSFPVLQGPDLTQNGDLDAFVVKVNPAGSGLIYSGYIGGNSDEHVNGIAVDVAGNAYVIGATGSNETQNFPLVLGPDLTYNDGGDVFVAKITEADLEPDTFAFADQAGVELATEITSSQVAVQGIEAPSAVSVVGGTYSIDGGAFTATPQPVANGQAVIVRHISSADYDTATDTVLTIGGVSDTFSSTTRPADVLPNSFAFVDQTGVPRSTEITSASVTVSGIEAPTAIAVSGGTYSIDGGAFTANPATVANGQTVTVRHTSAATYNTVTSTVLTIGGVSDTFSSTTRAAPRRGGGALSLVLLFGLASVGILRILRA